MDDLVTLHQCSACGEMFENYSELQQHNRLHEYQSVSDQLRPSTSTDAQIVSVPSTHSGKQELLDAGDLDNTLSVKQEKMWDKIMYPCPVCEKNFTSSCDFLQHQNCHGTALLSKENSRKIDNQNNPLGYVNIQGVSFTNFKVPNFEKHQCNLCHKKFGLYEELDKHCQEQHGELFNASTSIVFLKKEKSSEKCQTYQCNSCPGIFSTSIELQQHFQLFHCITSICLTATSTVSSIEGNSTPCQSPTSRSMQHKISEFEKRRAQNSLTRNTCPAIFAEYKHSSTSKSLSHHTANKLKNPYKCNSCNVSFAKYKQLQVHKRTHIERNLKLHVESEPNLTCEFCDKVFSTKSTLQRHLIIHMEGKPFKCMICLTQYNDDSTLRKHMNVHTKGKLGECSFCCEKVKSKKDLLKHLMTHTQCAYCSKPLSSFKKLSFHMLNHRRNGDNPFDQTRSTKTGNSDCEPQFEKSMTSVSTDNSTNIDKHKHNEESSINRDISNKSFNNMQCQTQPSVDHNERRLIIFDGNKSSGCHEANKMHSKQQVNADPNYYCEICNKEYHSMSKLYRHFFTHTNERPFKCIACNIQFRDDSQLRKHMDIHTNGTMNHCSICGVTVQSKIDMRKHLMTHTKCAYCGELLSSIKLLFNHMFNHKQNANNCQTVVSEKRNRSRGRSRYMYIIDNPDSQSEAEDNCVTMTSSSEDNITNIDEHRHNKNVSIEIDGLKISIVNSISLDEHMKMGDGSKDSPIKCDDKLEEEEEPIITIVNLSHDFDASPDNTFNNSNLDTNMRTYNQSPSCDNSEDPSKEPSVKCDNEDENLEEEQMIPAEPLNEKNLSPKSSDDTESLSCRKINHRKRKPRVVYGKNFICEICAKTFSVKSKLHRHFFVHTNDKPFKCVVCNMQYRDDSSLRKHMALHTNRKTDECDICGESVKSEFDMKRHLLTHTQCAYCGELLSSIRKLFNHMLNHSKNADNCQINITKEADVKPNGKSGSADNSVCEPQDETCMTPAKENEHMHSTKRSVYCELCDKPFIYVKSREKHMKTHYETIIRQARERSDKCDDKGENQEEETTPNENHSCKDSLGHGSMECLEGHSETSITEVSLSISDSSNGLHDKTQTDKQSFLCDICSQLFDDSHSFDIHMKMHNGALLSNTITDNTKNQAEPIQIQSENNVNKSDDRKPMEEEETTETALFECDDGDKWFADSEILIEYKGTQSETFDETDDLKAINVIKKNTVAKRSTLEILIEQNMETISEAFDETDDLKDIDVIKKEEMFNVTLDTVAERSTKQTPKILIEHNMETISEAFDERDDVKGNVIKKEEMSNVTLDTVAERSTKQTPEILIEHNMETISEAFDKTEKGIINVIKKEVSNVTSTKQTPDKLYKIYKCDQCDKIFLNKAKLNRHSFTHNPYKPFKCSICNFSSTDLGLLAKHLLTHLTADTNACEKCGFTDSSKSEMRKHMLTHTHCSYCDIPLPVINNVSEHMAIHSGFDADKCHILVSKLPNKVEMQATLKVQICDMCSKCFTSKRALKVHKNLAHKILEVKTYTTYKCEVCDKSFRNKSKLQRHSYTHSKVNPYKCEICKEEFRDDGILRRHVASHISGKNNKCDICGEAVGSKLLLRKHVMTHCQCSYCNIQLSSITNVNEHLRSHVGFVAEKFTVCVPIEAAPITEKQTTELEKLVCNLCGKCFTTLPIYQSHMTKKTCQFKCRLCHKSYYDDAGLSEHMKSHEPELVNVSDHTIDQLHRRHKCKHCDINFSDKSKLWRHLFTHTNIKPYGCEVCSKCFCDRSSLRKHVITHMRGGKKQCDCCGKIFESPLQSKKHLLTHTQCAFCKTPLSSISNMTTHMKHHSGETADNCQVFLPEQPTKPPQKVPPTQEKPVCSVCGTLLSSKQSLIAHMRQHTGDVGIQCVCEICGKGYGSTNKLKIHLEIHANKRSEPCDVCGKIFKTARYLRNHKQIHVKKVRGICHFCGRMFGSYGSLKYHEQTHSGDQRFSCNQCDKKFITKTNLTLHQTLHTGVKPFKCDVCDKAFRMRSDLKKHGDIHSEVKKYVCHVCNKSFFTKSGLHKHKFNHMEEKRINCKICGQSFFIEWRLRCHMLKHTKNRK